MLRPVRSKQRFLLAVKSNPDFKIYFQFLCNLAHISFSYFELSTNCSQKREINHTPDISHETFHEKIVLRNRLPYECETF